MRRDLGSTPEALLWVVNAYALAFGGLLMLGGRLADLIGSSRVLAMGLALFGAASLAGGRASSRARPSPPVRSRRSAPGGCWRRAVASPRSASPGSPRRRGRTAASCTRSSARPWSAASASGCASCRSAPRPRPMSRPTRREWPPGC
ncbi:hypothetical protein ACIO6T_09035 [Streptomyces sp. NPDC087532]|uniref:hypothetical protein n=2 Tax=unclassified Streptomyces TaxID=2593676 RepID=UPI003821F48D